MALANIRIVLVRPQGGANVGSVARAMKNMTLSDLVLVAPGDLDQRWMRSMATHGADVLAAARTCSSVADAVADCGLVIGTTARPGHYRGDPDTPRRLAPEIVAAAAHNRVALLFGPEDHGLSNDDLIACDRFVAIPSNPEFSSLNLAQAVMVCCYEIFLAAQSNDRPVAVADLASAADIDRTIGHLRTALLRIGFLNPDNPDHILLSLRRIFGRARLEPRDVRILLGMARQIDWAADQAGLALPGNDETGETS